MKKQLLICIVVMAITANGISQSGSFDIFTYEAPELFIKSELPARVQFSMKNNDTSICLITIYKSQPAQQDVTKDIMAQWNEYILKPLNKAGKKPLRIFTQQFWDGWISTVAIGNFYQGKKKSIVMLSSSILTTVTIPEPELTSA